VVLGSQWRLHAFNDLDLLDEALDLRAWVFDAAIVLTPTRWR
jgi:hypothetical protein